MARHAVLAGPVKVRFVISLYEPGLSIVWHFSISVGSSFGPPARTAPKAQGLLPRGRTQLEKGDAGLLMLSSLGPRPPAYEGSRPFKSGPGRRHVPQRWQNNCGGRARAWPPRLSDAGVSGFPPISATRTLGGRITGLPRNFRSVRRYWGVVDCGHTVGASVHVATWIETRMREPAASSVKQHLAALRQLFDWLVNAQRSGRSDLPAHTVHGPGTS
jgi:hypothetical protein